IVLGHFVATGIEPHHVFDLASANAPALEEFGTPKNRMLVPELNQPPDKLGECLLLLVSFLPIKPADLVVLAIGVVVAVLGPAEFVATEQHRHALRNKKRG